MAAADPLNLLLGKKKSEQAASAPQKSTAAPDLTDVSAALGRQRPAEAEPPAFAGYPSNASRASTTAGPNAMGALFEAAVGGVADIAGVCTSRAAAAISGNRAPSQASVPAPAPPPPSAGPGDTASRPVQAQGTVVFDDMLAAEKVHVVVRSCFLLVPNPLCELRGRLLATNYRLKFQTPKGTLREEMRWMQDARMFDVSMGSIEEVKDERATTAAGALELKLKVQTKDFRVLSFILSSDEEARNIIDAVAAFSCPGNSTLLFALKHAEQTWAQAGGVREDEGWQLYDPAQEYTRMGVESELIPNAACPWQVSGLNREYQLCPSYPSSLVLPKRMFEQEIRAVAGFRKRGRLPAMSWCGGHELSYASVWRCSQTTEGLMGQKCPEDHKMVECIRRGVSQQNSRDLLVIDLRPWKSAWANKAGGGGFEGYPNCRLVFGGIDNIHAVREAWRAMGAAVAAVVEGEVGSWMKDVANSGWYDYIGAILSSAKNVVKEVLEHKCSVMVHCSDGWDRTAQVTSLAMMCLDPQYRTQAGLLRLIQKEWCSFGHRFRTRLALGESPSGEFSPVFLQWLECVYQFSVQFPTAFEWTPTVLMRLAHEVFSNRFGTFLCDSEKERAQKVAPYSLSLWSALLRPREAATWRNPNYSPAGPVVPSVSQANYVIWEEFWFRYHPRGQRFSAGGSGVTSAQPPGPPPAAADPPSPPAAQSPAVMADREEEVQPALVCDGSAEPVASSLASASAPTMVDAQATASPASDVALGGESLFSQEEVAAAVPKKTAPKQVFADDEDDDDVFAKLG